MQFIPFSEARAQLANVLRGVESGDAPLVISRRGQASGVLMSFAQYQQLTGECVGFADCLDDWRTKYLAQDMHHEVKPFDSVRQLDDVRDFTW